MSEERIETPFGIVAFDKGFVSEEQIIEAFELQVKESLEGKEHRLIGENTGFPGLYDRLTSR